MPLWLPLALGNSWTSASTSEASHGKLHLQCEVHKCHSIAKSMFNLMPSLSSGMIKAALALKAGWMARFRSAFKNLLCQHVKVYHGEPPWVGRAEPAAYRACVIQLFSNCKRDQVESVSKLLNGDWQSDREIAHYCGGPSCCSSRDHTIAKMLESDRKSVV